MAKDASPPPSDPISNGVAVKLNCVYVTKTVSSYKICGAVLTFTVRQRHLECIIKKLLLKKKAMLRKLFQKCIFFLYNLEEKKI